MKIKGSGRAAGAYAPTRGKAGRTCSLCGAKPGRKCGRFKNVAGMPIWYPYANFHKER